MPDEDKNDIIKKINSAGEKDKNTDNQESNDNTEPELNDGEEKNFDESLHINENICNFTKINKTMIKNILKENFGCGCEDIDLDITLDDILNDNPEVEPAIKPSVKPNTTPSRRSKPYSVPIITPETSPKPKAITESIIETEAKNNWWGKNPNDLLKDWYRGYQLPKTLQDRKDAFMECAHELNKKFPTDKGRIEKMLKSIS